MFINMRELHCTYNTSVWADKPCAGHAGEDHVPAKTEHVGVTTPYCILHTALIQILGDLDNLHTEWSYDAELITNTVLLNDDKKQQKLNNQTLRLTK